MYFGNIKLQFKNKRSDLFTLKLARPVKGLWLPIQSVMASKEAKTGKRSKISLIYVNKKPFVFNNKLLLLISHLNMIYK